MHLGTEAAPVSCWQEYSRKIALDSSSCATTHTRDVLGRGQHSKRKHASTRREPTAHAHSQTMLTNTRFASNLFFLLWRESASVLAEPLSLQETTQLRVNPTPQSATFCRNDLQPQARLEGSSANLFAPSGRLMFPGKSKKHVVFKYSLVRSECHEVLAGNRSMSPSRYFRE